MLVSRGRATLLALGVATAGCGAASSLPGGESGGGGSGGNPLDGTWTAPLDSEGTIGTDTLTLSADGTAIETTFITSTQGVSCSGAVQLTGAVWTATATTITLSGGACTGGLTCAGMGVPCMAATTTPPTCGYTLSDGDDTLVITCQGTTITFTRQS
jgi:hypothetical protein